MTSKNNIGFEFAVETLNNLSKSDMSLKNGNFSVGATDGLYALINKMISDLAKIKQMIKIQEANIRSDIFSNVKEVNGTATTSIDVDGTTAVGGASPATVIANSDASPCKSTRANVILGAGLGSGNARHAEGSSTLVNTGELAPPAVLVGESSGSAQRAYSEQAVFGLLSRYAESINKLVNFEHGIATGASLFAETDATKNVTFVEVTP